MGEAPGASEEAGGEPFIGEAGKLLDQCLEAAGLARADLFITNSARCRPPDNRTPKPSEQTSCSVFTVRELGLVQPKVIVAVGGAALSALTSHRAVGKSRGSVIDMRPEYRSSVPVIATYHPAAALHNPAQRQRILNDIVSDFKMAQRLIGNAPEDEFTVVTPQTHGTSVAKETLKALAQCSQLAVDFEWETFGDAQWPWSRSIHGEQPAMVCVGFAGEIDGRIVTVSVPWEGAWEKAARALLSRVPTIYHLGLESSDIIWLLYMGIDPIIAGDSYTLAKLLNVSASGYGLGTLAPMLTDMPPGWKEEMGKRGRRYDDNSLVGKRPITSAEWEQLLVYNGRDCVATLKLHDRLMEMAHEQQRAQTLKLYTGLMLPVLKAFAWMAINGVGLDLDEIEKLEATIGERMVKLKQEIGDVLGVKGRYELVEKDSNIATLIERNLGIVLPRTSQGRPQMNEATRRHFRDEHPVFSLLDEQAHLKKRNTTYWTPWLELLDRQQSDRLHTVYRPSGTGTGRTSASSESGATLQQYPRKEAKQFVRAAPGRKLILADESQIELRVGAYLSGDKRLQGYYRAGKDVHRMTAAAVLALSTGLSIEQFLADEDAWASRVTKDQRQGAKPINFGFLYGAQEATFIESAERDYGIRFSMPQATQFRRAYFTLYSGVADWHKRAFREVQRGERTARTYFGRERDVVGDRDEDFSAIMRKLVNTPTQSIGNDITMTGMADFWDRVMGNNLQQHVSLVGYIHDAVVVEADDYYVDWAAGTLKYCLENPDLYGRLGQVFPLPLEAETKVGESWESATVYVPI